jgi:hypothetical protein
VEVALDSPFADSLFGCDLPVGHAPDNAVDQFARRRRLAPLELDLALCLIDGDFEVAHEGHPQQP